jgi:lipopolysaccharide biosynthesis regulator YciM
MSLDSTTITIVAAIIVVVILAVSASFMFSGRQQRRRVSDPYVAGLRSLVDGERDEAFVLLQKAIKTGKAPTDAYIRLGNLLRDNGDAGKALQIHRSLTVKPNLTRREKIELFINIAQDYSRLGNSGQAIAVLETALKNMGLKDPEVFRLLAREYHVSGKTEDAYRCLKELKRGHVVGDRELSLYLGTAGERLAEDNELKEARKLLQQALKHDSDNPSVRLALGNLEEKQNNQDNALDHWKRAAMASPELSAAALKSIEHVMFQRGTFGDVEKVYRDVLGARPWDEYATRALASFYKKQGRGEEAIEFLEEFRSMHPESIGSALVLTSLYATNKDAATLERFLEENESQATARNTQYECVECGFQSTSMRWHCPRCNVFDSFKEKHEA